MTPLLSGQCAVYLKLLNNTRDANLQCKYGGNVLPSQLSFLLRTELKRVELTVVRREICLLETRLANAVT